MSELTRLVDIIDRLRSSEGCPWDREQTFASMRPYLLEEVYEVLDAIDAEQPGSGLPPRPRDLEEELGDLLFVVIMMARMGEDSATGALPEDLPADAPPGSAGRRFDLESIAGRIAEKMILRHPHVFGSPDEREALRGKANGIAAWENRKARTETRPDGSLRSRLDGVPRALPGLLRAHRQGEKAAAVGFDWADPKGVINKVREELDELEEALDAGEQPAIQHELGDVLMSLASLGRHLDCPPEQALRLANERFAARFRAMEIRAHEQGPPLTELGPDELERWWEQAKAQLAQTAGFREAGAWSRQQTRV